MSYRVVREVLEKAQADGADRLVLLAIADVAYHDGVGWLPQGLPASRKSIASYAHCSERQVRRSVDALQRADELEVRRAQQGRRRKLIYRVVVGRLRDLEVEYDRLLFSLSAPFSTPDELAIPRPDRLAGRERGGSADPHGERDRDEGPEDDRTAWPPVPQSDDRPAETRRPDIYDRGDRTQESGRIENGPEKRSRKRSSAAAKSSSSTSAPPPPIVSGSPLQQELWRLQVPAAVRVQTLEDAPRAQAWLELARREAHSNVAGYFVAGFSSGEWPSDRGEVVSSERRRTGQEASLRNLVSLGMADEARHMIEVEWPTLTQIERNELHSLVEELISEQLPEAEAIERTRGAA